MGFVECRFAEDGSGPEEVARTRQENLRIRTVLRLTICEKQAALTLVMFELWALSLLPHKAGCRLRCA